MPDDKSRLKRAFERPAVQLNVPPPWPWYAWAVPTVLLIAAGIWGLIVGHHWTAGTAGVLAVSLVLMRRNRLSSYR